MNMDYAGASAVVGSGQRGGTASCINYALIYAELVAPLPESAERPGARPGGWGVVCGSRRAVMCCAGGSLAALGRAGPKRGVQAWG